MRFTRVFGSDTENEPLAAIIPSLPYIETWGRGHDTFTCRIICYKNRFCFFSLIGRETMFLKCCVLIGFHILTSLPVKNRNQNGGGKARN